MSQIACYNTYKTESSGNDCCSIQPEGKQKCPKCKQKAKGVLGKTLEHLLKDTSKLTLSSFNDFYYCKTSSCNVIYFRGEEILTQEDLNVLVGLKKSAKPANMCYCFGWTKERITEDINKHGKSRALDDIKQNMNTTGCACEIKNPSGNCCMADINKFIKEILHEN